MRLPPKTCRSVKSHEPSQPDVNLALGLRGELPDSPPPFRMCCATFALHAELRAQALEESPAFSVRTPPTESLTVAASRTCSLARFLFFAQHHGRVPGHVQRPEDRH